MAAGTTAPPAAADAVVLQMFRFIIFFVRKMWRLTTRTTLRVIGRVILTRTIDVYYVRLVWVPVYRLPDISLGFWLKVKLQELTYV